VLASTSKVAASRQIIGGCGRAGGEGQAANAPLPEECAVAMKLLGALPFPNYQGASWDMAAPPLDTMAGAGDSRRPPAQLRC